MFCMGDLISHYFCMILSYKVYTRNLRPLSLDISNTCTRVRPRLPQLLLCRPTEHLCDSFTPQCIWEICSFISGDQISHIKFDMGALQSQSIFRSRFCMRDLPLKSPNASIKVFHTKFCRRELTVPTALTEGRSPGRRSPSALSDPKKNWRRSCEESFNILTWTHRPSIQHDFQFLKPCVALFSPPTGL